MLKQSLKKLMSKGVSLAGRTGVVDRLEPWVIRRLAPRLLDPGVITRGTHVVKLRGGTAEVPCNPYQLFHRSPYWFGRLYEKHLDELMRRFLRQGDTVIDVGANYGHISLLAAGLVGPTGRVFAFEPNPELAQMLQEHKSTRRIEQLSIHGVALSDTDGAVQLHVKPTHIGASWIGKGREPDSTFTVAYDVQRARGDDVLAGEALAGQVMLKIDVEGHEPEVMEGLRSTIRSRVHLAVLEVTKEWIGGAAGVARLFDGFHQCGFRSYQLDGFCRRATRREVAALEIDRQTNIVFAHDDVTERLQ